MGNASRQGWRVRAGLGVVMRLRMIAGGLGLPRLEASTLSRGSLVPSGSSTLFQLRLAALRSADRTCDGDAPGWLALWRAAAPATCGLAIEEPTNRRLAVAFDEL